MKPRPVPVSHAGDRKDAGFTLVEALIALLVIAIGVFSLVALIPAGTRSTAKSGQQTRASQLAASCMERLLATPYNDAQLDDGTHQEATYPYPGNYYVSWGVEDNQPINSCKRITVRVRWPAPTSPFPVKLVAVTPRANDQGP